MWSSTDRPGTTMGEGPLLHSRERRRASLTRRSLLKVAPSCVMRALGGDHQDRPDFPPALPAELLAGCGEDKVVRRRD